MFWLHLFICIYEIQNSVYFHVITTKSTIIIDFLKTCSPEQDDWNFADDIFQSIPFTENCCI